MNIISTSEAKCRDCYKCIRACPVNAIRIKVGASNNQLHAQVIEELCVHDGFCTGVCPQKAKVVISYLEEVKNLVDDKNSQVIASVEPSFAVALPLANPDLFPALLRRLGFSVVSQTAVGAELISLKERRINAPMPVITSDCPVVVNLVERHYPHLIPHLSPLISPMIAHGRLLKKQYPGSVVVYIGPCIAQKGEALADGVQGTVDYVLGFKEVWEWIEQEGIDLQKISPAEFDGYNPGQACLFPLEGGHLLINSLSTSLLDKDVQTVTGIGNCIDFFNNFSEENISERPAIMELKVCNGGCLGGPYNISAGDIYLKKQKMMSYYSRKTNEASGNDQKPQLSSSDLYRKFENKKGTPPDPTSEQIESILALTDKLSPEDELDCGACGFDTCREKAAAVFQGKAELQMCVPYMRKRAESILSLIMHALPDGMIVFDENLTILEINSNATKIFDCTRKVIGQKLDVLLDPTEFQRVFAEKRRFELECGYLENQKIIRQIVFPLENKAVGIFTDITNELKQQEELSLVKAQTIDRANEVIKKQLRVAQLIAGLLGETTAETKAELSQLIKFVKDYERKG